jgi:signal transduction histidine kinase
VALAISLVQQRITGNITIYLFAIVAYGAGFYSTPREGLALLFGSMAAFAVALPFVQPNELLVIDYLIVTFDFALCFWAVSRLIYSLKARDFANLQTIARQAERLEAANLNLATVNRELIEANRLKAQLIEIAAHDLRDPLHTIGGLAQTLREETARQEQLLPWVEGIAQSSRRMLGLVENLLTDAESGAGRIALQKEPADLRALVESVLAAHAPLAAAKSLRIQFATGAKAAQPARVDPVRCRQIVENLVSNAIKYSPAGKSIWITLEPDPAGGHRLSVRDEGPGLTPADQSHLFTRFQRLSARPTAGETSTGLGLAITKNLVGLHGGRIWAESPGPGQGANFIVVLP